MAYEAEAQGLVLERYRHYLVLLGHSETPVGGFLRRGMAKLRELLQA